jgi:hypothetical protein
MSPEQPDILRVPERRAASRSRLAAGDFGSLLTLQVVCRSQFGTFRTVLVLAAPKLPRFTRGEMMRRHSDNPELIASSG